MLGTEGEVEEDFRCRMGSGAHITLLPGLRGLGDSVWGHPASPHDSAAESGVLPLLPEQQQRSEKPSSLIRLMQVGARGWYRLPLRAPAGGQRAELSRPGQLLLGFLEGGYGSVSPPWEEGPRNLLYRCPQAQIFWGDTPSPITSQPGPWGPDCTQSSGTMGSTVPGDSAPLQGRFGLGDRQDPPLLPASCHSKVPQTGNSFKRLCSHSPSPSAPLAIRCRAQHPAGQLGAGKEFGWRCRGRRPWGKGQTGEAGTGTMSPLVNNAGPCSLFKALNRGWYLSSAELEAGGCWSWFNTLRQGWKAAGGGRCYPRWEHVGGVSCRHMSFLSLPPTIYMVMGAN